MSDSRAAAFHPLLPRTYRSDTHSAGEDGKIGKEDGFVSLETEDAKARTTSALQTLYLLSPQVAEWLVQSLQEYALTSSVVSLTRPLRPSNPQAQLPRDLRTVREHRRLLSRFSLHAWSTACLFRMRF